MLLLNINKKSYTGSAVAPGHLSLRDIEGLCSKLPMSQTLTSQKGQYLGDDYYYVTTEHRQNHTLEVLLHH